MNLFAKLSARHEAGHPVRVGLIGAGKFGSMFLAQALKIPALHIAGIADLSPDTCLLYTSPSPRDLSTSRMPSSA